MCTKNFSSSTPLKQVSVRNIHNILFSIILFFVNKFSSLRDLLHLFSIKLKRSHLVRSEWVWEPVQVSSILFNCNCIVHTCKATTGFQNPVFFGLESMCYVGVTSYTQAYGIPPVTCTVWKHISNYCIIITYIEGGQGLTHALLNEVVCDPTRGVLIEHWVHEGNLGSAASCLCLGRTELSNSEENMH